MILLRHAWLLVALLLVAAPGDLRAAEQPPAPPAADVTPDPWPKRLQEGGVTYTVFQPQLDSWDGYRLAAHAAVSVLPDGSKDATFGVVDLTAVTVVDRVGRAVSFEDVKVVRSSFPSAPADADRNGAHIQTAITTGVTTMSLDRLEQSLKVIAQQD